ncbi:hypothetical protein AVEN_154514-1 [Araneus ventricosus]|uniref:RNase H type-1 domain-containing protein n=1 Tax=Araneus ventricosus TaxID=182803 RepID=A0A4Y2HWH9_ARAVE|nr:hypothetical protein AVEN_154514-1 [Araneus ventricosus]
MDGSKIGDKTGSAFCAMEEDTTKYEWMAQLNPFNTVFQAELLATQEACLWASKTNQQIKVWSDSESSLHSIASIDTKSPIAQQTQEILLKSTNIKLGWIKAHVGYSGIEAADVLAKKATQEGIPTFIPAPRNHIKRLLQKESRTGKGPIILANHSLFPCALREVYGRGWWWGKWPSRLGESNSCRFLQKCPGFKGARIKSSPRD